jgi:hypothetical protein
VGFHGLGLFEEPVTALAIERLGHGVMDQRLDDGQALLMFIAHASCLVSPKERCETRVEFRLFKRNMRAGCLVQAPRHRTRLCRIPYPKVCGQSVKAGAQHLMVFPEADE